MSLCRWHLVFALKFYYNKACIFENDEQNLKRQKYEKEYLTKYLRRTRQWQSELVFLDMATLEKALSVQSSTTRIWS